MTTDFKNPPRIRDKQIFKDFHAGNPACLFCLERPAQAHHILSRAQGGGDVDGNLIPLCARDHSAYHGQAYTTRPFGSDSIRVTPQMVRRRIASFIRSDEGMHSALYLSATLGAKPSAWFLEKLSA